MRKRGYLILAVILVLVVSHWLPNFSTKNVSEINTRNYTGSRKAIELIQSNSAACPNNINPFFLEKIPTDWPDRARSAMSVTEKKQSFFSMMIPLSLEANKSIRELRGKIKSLSLPADSKVKDFIVKTAQNYKIETKALSDRQILEKLLTRVDAVPNSIVLAQAAYESAYGCSRFAIEGNSLFGQWSYKKGIKPKEQRTATKGDYRIASFDNLLQSFDSYILNLNTSKAYKEFREIRQKEASSKNGVDPFKLTAGLKKYSEMGQYYVDTLNSIIKSNNLLKFDNCNFNAQSKLWLKDQSQTVGH